MPTGVYIRTEYHKKINSESHMGTIGPNIGRVFSKETVQKMSDIHKGIHYSPKTEFKKGIHPTTEFKKGEMIGDKNPNYKNPEDRITITNRLIRTHSKYIDWRANVFNRDGFTCQKCGVKSSGNLNAHHIKMFSIMLKENSVKSLEDAIVCECLWDISNGITYCEECHKLLK